MPSHFLAGIRLISKQVKSTSKSSQNCVHPDPVVRLNEPEQADALRSLALLYIDVGRFDEYNLQMGARRFVAGLNALGIAHHYEEFDGGHRGMAWRYGVSLAHLAEALK